MAEDWKDRFRWAGTSPPPTRKDVILMFCEGIKTKPGQWGVLKMTSKGATHNAACRLRKMGFEATLRTMEVGKGFELWAKWPSHLKP